MCFADNHNLGRVLSCVGLIRIAPSCDNKQTNDTYLIYFLFDIRTSKKFINNFDEGSNIVLSVEGFLALAAAGRLTL